MLIQPCIPPPVFLTPLTMKNIMSFHFCLVLTHNHPFQSVTFNLALTTTSHHSVFFRLPSCFVLVQCVLEEMASREVELSRLRERAHHLWEGQAAGKGFVHRVSQLSAQYLALSNLTKVTLLPPSNPVAFCPLTMCESVSQKCCSMLCLIHVLLISTVELSVQP